MQILSGIRADDVRRAETERTGVSEMTKSDIKNAHNATDAGLRLGSDARCVPWTQTGFFRKPKFQWTFVKDSALCFYRPPLGYSYDDTVAFLLATSHVRK